MNRAFRVGLALAAWAASAALGACHHDAPAPAPGPAPPPPPPTDARAASREPPTIPVGLDAYRHWDMWPALRLGMRARMESTYDRAGGNEGADASHFVRQEGPNAFVPLDVAGPGVLTFVRTNQWH